MARSLAPIAALLFAVALLITGNGLQQVLLPLRANLEAFAPLAIGIMGAAYFCGFALGCWLGGHLIKRVGHIRVFTGLTAIASSVALLHHLTADPLSWWIFRGLTGFCISGLFLVIESWLNEKASNETRGRVMSLYTMINFTVIIAGQMMLTLSDPLSFTLFAMASLLVSLAAVPVAMTVAAQPAQIVEVRLRPRALYRLSPVGVVSAFLIGAAGGSFWSLAPLFASDLGADSEEIAIFLSIAVAGGALTQIPIGRLSDRLDRRYVLAGASFLAVGAGITLALINPSRLSLALLGAAFGATALPLYAIAVAHTFDHATENFVETASGLLLVSGIGSIIGPLVASGTMQALGPGGLFLTTAAFHGLLTLYATWRCFVSASVPEAERTSFDLTATAPTTAPFEEETLESLQTVDSKIDEPVTTRDGAVAEAASASATSRIHR